MQIDRTHASYIDPRIMERHIRQALADPDRLVASSQWSPEGTLYRVYGYAATSAMMATKLASCTTSGRMSGSSKPMADQPEPMPDRRKFDPETEEAIKAFMDPYLAERAARGPMRTATEVILTDPTLRPYSMRLTAREKYRVRMMSRLLGVSPSELARRFILEGLLRAEAEYAAQNGETKGEPRLQALKLALLNAYDLVEQLDRPDPPTT